MTTSTGTPGRQSPARSVQAPESSCRRAACAAGRRRHVNHVEQRARIERAQLRQLREIVRASSPRLSSESGSAHSCRASPNPFGDGGDQNGWRSCRSSVRRVRSHVLDAECAHHRDEPVLGRAELPRVFAPGLGLIDQCARDDLQVAARSTRTPRAMRSTAAAGGSSLTKWVTSLVATKRAVDGCWHSARMARSPSSTPASLIALPSTVLLPGSCSSSWKTKPTGPPVSGARCLLQAPRAAPRPGWRACWMRSAGSADAGDGPAGQDLAPAPARPAACSRR